MEIKQWKDVLHIVSGKNQKAVENPNGKYPIYGSGGLMGYADDYLCEAGTTIVGRKGTINRPIFVTEPFWNIDTAFGIAPDKGLVPKYLYYFCVHFNFMPLDKSTGRPSLAKSITNIYSFCEWDDIPIVTHITPPAPRSFPAKSPRTDLQTHRKTCPDRPYGQRG